ncbi:MAG: DNA topoisomerase I, partial [Alphaproteobacteria bacterium]|nr:DNA topoisomerase I [Alphaproteobacteria bacterium]
KAGVGRYGAYLLMDGKFTTLPADDHVLDIGLNRAVTVLIEQTQKGDKGSKPSGRSLGKHPEDQKPVTVKNGRYGPYVQHSKVNATIPKDQDPENITLEAALPLLAARLGKMAAKKK